MQENPRMNTNTSYATRKRRKPVQKPTIKPSQSDGAKSNPSKRHRDRLNTELDRLADLLPFSQDIISKLDKLSVLRLSVSYLRAKGFFEVALKSRSDANGNPQEQRKTISAKPAENLSVHEGELLLQAINGFVLVVTSDGLVFYTSSTIQEYLGFQQSDVIHQSVFELIHTEDRLEFQRQLHWALDPAQSTEDAQSEGDKEFVHPPSYYDPDQLPPENSSFMERNFMCRLRCLLDNSSGFLTMNFQGRLKFLHGQNQKRKDGSTIPPQLAFFALATPLQSPSILEIRTKNLIFRTKHKLDFTPIGCDAKGSLVLGYTEAELCVRGTGYQFIHAADMLYCADNHVRMIKTGESGMTVFRLLTKDSGWTWVQANARLVYKNGRPDYIIATQRPLTEEEGAEHLRKRSLQVPFMFATGEAVLYEVTFPMAGMRDPMEMKAKSKMSKGSASKPSSRADATVDPASLLGAMLRQDESVYICPPAAKRFSFENFLSEAKDELNSILSSGWQEHIMPVANSNVLKQEQIGSPVISNTVTAQDSADLFADNKNNELYNIMKSLGMDFEDLEFIQQDDTFFKTEFDSSDIGEIDLTDEILTYVQESLNKRPDCMYSSSIQQQPSTEGIVQQALETQKPPQSCQRQTVPPQLCQKMKHMQVNGRLTNWNVVNSMPVTYQQTLQEQYDFSKFHNINTDFPFKLEATDVHATCTQNFMPFQQQVSVVPAPMNFTDLNLFADGVNSSEYPISSDIDAYLNCLPQNSQNQSCVINPQPMLVTSQPCYAGAASVYPCIPETETACLNPSLYNPVVEDQQPLLNEFQNGFSGGNFMEQYPPQLNITHNTQNTKPFPPPNHRTDPRPYKDMAQSGFM